MPKRKVEEPDSSEDEWEEVEETNLSNFHSHKKEAVEIEFDLPDVVKKQQSKKDRTREWVSTLIKRAFNKAKKDRLIEVHKTHLLCLIGIGLSLNEICNELELQAFFLSLLPLKLVKLYSFNTNKENLVSLVEWINNKFMEKTGVILQDTGFHSLLSKRHSLADILHFSRKLEQKIDLVMIHLLVFRSLGFHARLVMSLQPKSHKAPTEKELSERAKHDPQALEKVKKTTSQRKKVNGNKKIDSTSISQLDGANDELLTRRTTRSQARVLTSFQNNVEINDKSVTKGKQRKLIRAMKPKSLCKQQGGKINHKDVKSSEPMSSKQRKSTISKYVFAKDEEVDPFSDKRLSTASKISRKVKSSYSQEFKNSQNIKIGKSGNIKSNYFINSHEDNVSSVKLKAKRDAESNSEEESYSDFSDNFDDDFVVKPKAKTSRTRFSGLPAPKSSSVLSKTKTRGSVSKPDHSVDQWIEVYLHKLGWICIDCISGVIDQTKKAEILATKPLHYVVGFDNEQCIKDVTARYASNWLTATRKLRIGYVDQNWWKKTLLPYKTSNVVLDEEENECMKENLLSQPLPTSIGAFKNHPLYALRRHLLKYEAIYPPDVPAIGYIRGEEVLSRSSVHVLHTREKWLQSALSVRDGEEPYKIVASYLLNKKLNRDSSTLSLALFGKWQTGPYKPPVAKDGKVPRNEYGNVDLFQSCMLPVGCVHLRLPSLNNTARKLNIDIATAVVGFDTHNGFPHPTVDGYVVCEEHEAILRSAWEEDQLHAAEREQERLDKKIYSRWKLLIKGLLALDRVRSKYSVKNDNALDEPGLKQKKTALSGDSWQAKRLKEAKKMPPRYSKRVRKKPNTELFPFEINTL